MGQARMRLAVAMAAALLVATACEANGFGWRAGEPAAAPAERASQTATTPVDAPVGAERVTPTSQPDQSDPCGAADYRHLIGETFESVDRTVLPLRSRFICHGCLATTDVVRDRLNLYLDPDGRVERLSCG